MKAQCCSKPGQTSRHGAGKSFAFARTQPTVVSHSLTKLVTVAKPMCPAIFGPAKRKFQGAFLSLFGGAARVCEALRDLGCESMVLDFCDSVENDLSTDSAAAIVSKILRQKDQNGNSLVSLLGIEPECASWSRARGGGKGPPAIRSRCFLMGLPGVRPHDQVKLDAGNRQMQNACCWIEVSISERIPGYLEQPCCSWFWLLDWVLALLESGRAITKLLCQPESQIKKMPAAAGQCALFATVKLAAKSCFQNCVCDDCSVLFLIQLQNLVCNITLQIQRTCKRCQYGSPHQKRTKLLIWGISKRDELHIEFKQCHMKGKCCSKTGEPHVLLRGTDDAGNFKTAAAQVYPMAMAIDIASQFSKLMPVA